MSKAPKDPTPPTAKLQKNLFLGTSVIRRMAGVIEPPFQMARLVQFLDLSPSMRPAIDAYAVNIDGFGQGVTPTIDLARDDIEDIVRSAIRVERRLEAQRALLEEGKIVKVTPATPAEIKARVAELAEEMEDERQAIDAWMRRVAGDMTFTHLRKKTRVDLELTGNAYWEVRRNLLGQPVQINHVPAASMLATSQGDDVAVKVKIHLTPITIAEDDQTRRFRKYLQMNGNAKPVYFKEHGDRRLMSAQSGVYYETIKAMAKDEPKATAATEIRHFRIPTPQSEVYGVPRWAGCMAGLTGARNAEETNCLYFTNKSIPPLAILISGATVSKETIDELRDTIASDIQGVKNFHRTLIIQATSSTDALSAGTAKVELKPLMQISEGQFMVYIEKNAAALVGSFRLPQLYRGSIEGYNKANAEIAVETTEQQVFRPEREEFDDLINRSFFYDLDVRYWRFASNGPPPANLEKRAEILIKAAVAGIATLNEAREVLSAFFGRELERIDSPWADYVVPVASEAALLEVEQLYLPEDTGAASEDSTGATTNGKRKQGQGRSRRKAVSLTG